MTENNDVTVAPVSEEKSADQILKEIETVQRELDAEPAKTQPEPEPVSKSDQDQSTPTDKPSQEEATSEPPAASDPAGSHKVEIEEWMKKKGIKDQKGLANYLKGLDREFHRSRKEVKPAAPQIPAQVVPPPQYERPAPPVPIEEIAQNYGMHPDDLKNVIRLVDDASEVKLRKRLMPYIEEVEGIKRDLSRERELQRLESDPLFQNRDVQYEMGKILEEDPSIWGKEPEPMRYAFNQALSNMGRRLVEASFNGGSSSGDSRMRPPTTPPPAGRGSASGIKGVSIKPTDDMTQDKFMSLPLADQEKYLKSRGAFRTTEQG